MVPSFDLQIKIMKFIRIEAYYKVMRSRVEWLMERDTFICFSLRFQTLRPSTSRISKSPCDESVIVPEFLFEARQRGEILGGHIVYPLWARREEHENNQLKTDSHDQQHTLVSSLDWTGAGRVTKVAAVERGERESKKKVEKTRRLQQGGAGVRCQGISETLNDSAVGIPQPQCLNLLPIEDYNDTSLCRQADHVCMVAPKCEPARRLNHQPDLNEQKCSSILIIFPRNFSRITTEERKCIYQSLEKQSLPSPQLLLVKFRVRLYQLLRLSEEEHVVNKVQPNFVKPKS